ncbi:MAG: ECF transporter S component [Saccharofermentanales bacterium]
MKKITTKNLVLSGMFLALGIVLPFITGGIPEIGSRLLPMHIPVLICGFVCGWPYGLVIGFITPLLRSLLFTMPPMYPVAIAMAFELAAYGALTGIFYKLFPKKDTYIYVTLVLSMLGGRIIWGSVQAILLGFGGKSFSWAMFLAQGFVNAIPGIVLQLILIPVLIIALKDARLIGREDETGYPKSI